jgi:hypothetical protein
MVRRLGRICPSEAVKVFRKMSLKGENEVNAEDKREHLA